MSEREALQARLGRMQFIALILGIVGSLACVAIGAVTPARLFPAYLVSYLFWLGLGVGSLGLLMLHSLVGGAWGRLIRAPLRASTATMIPLAILFLPLLLGTDILYPWTDPDHVERSEAVREKIAYLNMPFFLGRAGVIFAIWIGLGWVYSRSIGGAGSRRDRLAESLGGPGLVLYVLSVTFASVDWSMSIEPDWFSSIYGVMRIVGQALSALAFTTSIALVLSGKLSEPATEDRSDEHDRTASWFNDLGNLLLAFVMLWAYIAFSQFLIIWNGNLTEEIPWYLKRTRGGWQWLALVLVLFHFFLPFLVLLLRTVKRRARLLLAVAVMIVVMHLLDIIWLVMPAFSYASRPSIDPLAIVLVGLTVVAVGGIWTAAFLWRLKRESLDVVGEASTHS